MTYTGGVVMTVERYKREFRQAAEPWFRERFREAEHACVRSGGLKDRFAILETLYAQLRADIAAESDKEQATFNEREIELNHEVFGEIVADLKKEMAC